MFPIIIACDCNLTGSVNRGCNVETGQCNCKSYNIVGLKCESCREGYYGYPGCKGTSYLSIYDK